MGNRSPKAVVSVRLDRSVIDLMDSEAAVTGEGRAGVISRLVRDHLGTSAVQERELAHQRIMVLAGAWGTSIASTIDRATELALAIVSVQRAELLDDGKHKAATE